MDNNSVEFVNRILELGLIDVKEIDGVQYTKQNLHRLPEVHTAAFNVMTLDGIIDYIKSNIDNKEASRHFIQIENETEINLISTLNKEDGKRDRLVKVERIIQSFEFNRYHDREKFITELQSRFVSTKDLKSIQDIAASITKAMTEKFEDDGIKQDIELKQNIIRATSAEIKNPFKLSPIRIFPEAKQPISDFVFRIKSDEKDKLTFALFEADGGLWKTEAIANIKEYLKSRLDETWHVIG